jgi:ketosteroid isomerase-like protein
MSQEHVDLVRGVIEASERGDMDAVFAAYDPEIEWDISALPLVAPGLEPAYRGHGGVRSFWRTWFEAFEASFDYEEFIDRGDTVVTILSQRVRGRVSGIEQDWLSYGQNWTIRDGRVIRVEFFPDRAAALAAAP